MLTCFLCKKLGAKRTVARIRGDYYFAKGFDFVKASIEADRVINPELLCAESAYNILRLPSAIKMETFAADKLEVAEFIVPDDSPAAGVTLAELKRIAARISLSARSDAAAKRLSPKARTHRAPGTGSASFRALAKWAR